MKHCLAIFAMLALVACGVDNKDMEKKIKAQLSEHLKVKSVSCPSGKSMSEGTKFDCKVTFDDDKAYDMHVTIQKDKQFTAEWDDETKPLLLDELKE